MVDFEGAASVRRAIYVGVVGARMVKDGVMEAQEVFIKPEQNKAEFGFGVGKASDGGDEVSGYGDSASGDANGGVESGGGDTVCEDGNDDEDQRSSCDDIENLFSSHSIPPLLPLMSRFYGQPTSNFPTFEEAKAALRSASIPDLAGAAAPTPASGGRLTQSKAMVKLRNAVTTLKKKILYSKADQNLVKMMEDGRVSKRYLFCSKKGQGL